MQPRKTIAANEKIEHTGDLPVDNIGKNAIVNLTNSELIVKEDVEAKAEIRLVIPKKEPVKIGNATIGTLKGKSIFTDGFIMKQGSSQLMVDEIKGDLIVGSRIIIGDRIQTSQPVIDLGNDHYMIKATQKDGGQFTALIDGKLYKANTYIELKGKAIFIDGVLQSEMSIEKKAIASVKPRIVIHGSIHEGVIIHSDKEIEVKKNVGENCNLTSTGSSRGIRAKTIGNHTIITAYGKIVAEIVGDQCNLTSTDYGIVITQIGNATTVTADMDIIVKGLVGEKCEFISKTGNVEIHGRAGDNLTVTAHNKIEVQVVGHHAKLTSNNSSVTAHTLGELAEIQAEDDIEITHFCPEDAKLNSTSGRVKKPESIEKFSLFSVKPQEEKETITRFLCPITKEFMLDPVIFQDGLTYDRSAIENKLKELGYKDNNIALLLTPNTTLNAEGAKYLESHPDLADKLVKKYQQSFK